MGEMLVRLLHANILLPKITKMAQKAAKNFFEVVHGLPSPVLAVVSKV